MHQTSYPNALREWYCLQLVGPSLTFRVLIRTTRQCFSHEIEAGIFTPSLRIWPAKCPIFNRLTANGLVLDTAERATATSRRLNERPEVINHLSTDFACSDDSPISTSIFFKTLFVGVKVSVRAHESCLMSRSLCSSNVSDQFWICLRMWLNASLTPRECLRA